MYLFYHLCLMQYLELILFLLGDIAMGTYHTYCFTIFIQLYFPSVQDPDPMTIFMFQSMGIFIILCLSVDIFVDIFPGLFSVIWMYPVIPGLYDIRQFIVTISKHLFPSWREIDTVFEDVPVPNPIITT